MKHLNYIALFAAACTLCEHGTAKTFDVTYASGDGVVINEVRENGALVADSRPNTGSVGTVGSQSFFSFALPNITPGELITTATFSAQLVTITDKTEMANLDLYAYGSNTLGAVAGDYQTYDGTAGYGDNPANFTGTRVADNFIPASGYVDEQVYSVTDGALLTLLQSLYDASGAPTSDYIVFRGQFDWDDDSPSSGSNRFRLSSHTSTSSPVLTFDTIPEPGSSLLALFGLGALGICRRRSR